jgi:hypothetical protein
MNQEITWDTGSSLWKPTTKPLYNVADPAWNFDCTGTSYNTSAASALVASITGNAAAVTGPPGCLASMGDFLWPTNIVLDFTSGWQIKTPTDGVTVPGTATQNSTDGATANCKSDNTTSTCAGSNGDRERYLYCGLRAGIFGRGGNAYVERGQRCGAFRAGVEHGFHLHHAKLVYPQRHGGRAYLVCSPQYRRLWIFVALLRRNAEVVALPRGTK